jgi:hypothetical protein
MSEHEREKAMARKLFLAEGSDITAQVAADKRRLLAIKNQKLEILKAAGVPDKYMTELAKKRVCLLEWWCAVLCKLRVCA